MNLQKKNFYLIKKNNKIKFLCYLIQELNKEYYLQEEKKKEIIFNILELDMQGNKYAYNLENILDNIRVDLDKGIIFKKDLEKFLNIKKVKKENEEKVEEDDDQNYVIEKLGLITLILYNYNPFTKYAEYKYIIEKINEKVEQLNFIKDSLVIFHKNLF